MENNKNAAEKAPLWVTIVRGFQIFFAVVILGLAAYLINGKYFNEMGFSIFCSLLTWFVVAYQLLSTKIASLEKFHNILAAMAADGVMIIFWLSSMGAGAALRASFKYAVKIGSCYNDGSLVNSRTCTVYRKRAAVAGSSGLASMSAVAGLSALQMLLFIATLVITFLQWRRQKASAAPAAVTTEAKEEGYPMMGSQQAEGMPQQPQGMGYQQPQAMPQQQPYMQQQQPYMQQQQQQPYVQQQPQQPYMQHPGQTQSPPPQQYGQAPMHTQSPPPQEMYNPPPMQAVSPHQQQQMYPPPQ